MLQVEIPNSCSSLANFSSNKSGVEDQSHLISVTASKVRVRVRHYGLEPHICTSVPLAQTSDAQ